MVAFTLNSKPIQDVTGWESARVNAIFQEFSQPDISVDTLTFGKDACSIIDNWIAENGYYAKLPFSISKENIEVFNGYLDLSDPASYKIHNGKYIAKLAKFFGINDLKNKIEGYTFGLLASRTTLTTTNIPYIVDRVRTPLEEAMLSITTLLLVKELNESVKRVSESAKDLSVALVPVVSARELLNASLQFLLDLAYTASMLIALKNIILEIINDLIPIVKYNKGFKIKDHIESFVSHIGYNGVEFGMDVENIYYFPSKNQDNKANGIPNVNDYGFTLQEMFDLISDLFNTEVSVDSDGVVQIRTEGDPYFKKNSTYTMQNVLIEDVRYNTDEIVGTRLISFATDVTDEWTIENYTGTAYEIHTRSSINAEDSTIKGFERISLPVCLGNRKEGLTNLEKAIKAVASLADKLIKLFGGNSSLANKVQAKVGLLKVAQENWSLPKVVKLDSNLRVPSSRSVWSAKYLYENFYQYKSFVLNGYNYQRRIFIDKEIPLCIEDYNKLIENSYFVTDSGALGKFTSLEMEVDTNKAVASYWIEEIFDENLNESYVEP